MKIRLSKFEMAAYRSLHNTLVEMAKCCAFNPDLFAAFGDVASTMEHRLNDLRREGIENAQKHAEQNMRNRNDSKKG